MLKAKKKEAENITKCACGKPMKATALACVKCSEDLNYIIKKRSTEDGSIYTLTGKITLEQFLDYIKETGLGSVGKCVFCGGNYVLGGNNPRPVVKDADARCCAQCNDNFVIKTRLNEIVRHHKKSH